MNKHIILALIIISTFGLKGFTQTQYFYEFSVPGLSTKTDATNITNAINELGINNLRVDEFSGKVLCFANSSFSATDFSEKLNSSSYYVFFFNSGIQGTNPHLNKTISEWNQINKPSYTEKAFVAIALNPFNQPQKDALKTHLESNLNTVQVSFSPNNKKVLIYTDAVTNKAQIKKLLYGYKFPNKLTNLIEIYK